MNRTFGPHQGSVIFTTIGSQMATYGHFSMNSMRVPSGCKTLQNSVIDVNVSPRGGLEPAVLLPSGTGELNDA
jgi:hypothetical protein